MHREHHRWYSPRLNREMELLIHGHAGACVLVFPTSQGRFYEYEDRGMVAALPAGSLVLADLGYFGFAWFDDLTDAALWWVSRLREQTSYAVIHTFYHRGDTLDALVWLGKHRADRAKHAVRLVQFRHHGTLHRYVTNVTAPATLPLADLTASTIRQARSSLRRTRLLQPMALMLGARTRSASRRPVRHDTGPMGQHCGWMRR